ncbi:MAG TPA: ISAs1 family transposase [Gemmataceae bacterium]|jgi:predicted transposase YbfD/YdcC|nr:ISAs1 family transposase [Gemmataceae bacterium]
MVAKEQSNLVEALTAVPDPRRQCQNLRHRLVDVLVLGFCGVLCGCDDFVEIAEFGRSKEDFFRRFLELPHGIPSHDTFRRVFQAVCPQALQRCLIQWLHGVRHTAPPADGADIGIDGKALRRTFDRARGLGALHVVSAWATANGLTLGQVAVDAKSNEITAIPHLIELLDLKGCVVTIDAAGCQKDIAAQIVAKDADYVLALKENQPGLYDQVSDYFLKQLEEENRDGKLRRHRRVETGHGRTETRETFVAPVPPEMVGTGAWLGLATLVMVIRECVDHSTGKASDEVRYFISSLPAKVRRLAGAVRGHWGIENGLHWVLDVAFNEDRMRQRNRKGIENLALLNRLAVSVLRQDKTVKAGVKCKRKTAGWDDDYLLHLLFNTD